MRKLQGVEYIKLLKTCASRRRMISSDKSISIDLKHALVTELYVGALLGTDYQQMYVDMWIEALQKEVKSKCK